MTMFAPTIRRIKKVDEITLIDLITWVSTINTIIEILKVETIGTIEIIKAIETISSMPDLTFYGSSGVAFRQTDAGAGAWQNPNGNDDPDGGWFYGAWAYDDNVELCAYNNASALPEWTTPLHLMTASISSNKLRFYAKTEDGKGETDHKIDIDVLRNGVWIHVYEGHFVEEVWIEKSYPQGKITEARIRFYSVAKVMSLCEFDFWQVPSTGGVMIVEEQGLLESPPEGKTITAKGYTYDGDEMATRTFYEGEELLFTITMTYVDGKLSSQVRT